VWGSIWSAFPQKAVIIDTLGNILNQTILVDNEWMAHTNKTHDDKLLFFTNKYDVETEEYDAYLFKLNQKLEHDTFYTYPYLYDTLCPYPIISDTILLDSCDIIVGIEEEKERKKESERLVIYPNPAESMVNCRVIIDCLTSA